MTESKRTNTVRFDNFAKLSEHLKKATASFRNIGTAISSNNLQRKGLITFDNQDKSGEPRLKLGGRGYTKPIFGDKYHEKKKKRRKMADKSRRINRITS